MCTEVEPLALRPEKLTSRALARALSAKLTMHLCGIYGRPALTSILFEKNFRIPLILNIRGGLLQPRVTCKSGWITFAAGANTLERAQRQIAACLLGIQILEILRWET